MLQQRWGSFTSTAGKGIDRCLQREATRGQHSSAILSDSANCGWRAGHWPGCIAINVRSEHSTLLRKRSPCRRWPRRCGGSHRTQCRGLGSRPATRNHPGTYNAHAKGDHPSSRIVGRARLPSRQQRSHSNVATASQPQPCSHCHSAAERQPQQCSYSNAGTATQSPQGSHSQRSGRPLAPISPVPQLPHP